MISQGTEFWVDVFFFQHFISVHFSCLHRFWDDEYILVYFVSLDNVFPYQYWILQDFLSLVFYSSKIVCLGVLCECGVGCVCLLFVVFSVLWFGVWHWYGENFGYYCTNFFLFPPFIFSLQVCCTFVVIPQSLDILFCSVFSLLFNFGDFYQYIKFREFFSTISSVNKPIKGILYLFQFLISSISLWSFLRIFISSYTAHLFLHSIYFIH